MSWLPVFNDHSAWREQCRQNSHSSQHFKGAHAVHEGRLLTVCPGHEVPHVAGYGP